MPLHHTQVADPQVLLLLNTRQVNEEWISDKARFQYDGLKRQRLDVPYVKTAEGALAPATWQQALEAVAAQVSQANGNEIKAVAGKLADAESMIAMKVKRTCDSCRVVLVLPTQPPCVCAFKSSAKLVRALLRRCR